MTIEIFDAFNRMSFLNINRITNFLHEHLEDCKDPKKAILNSLNYAAKEITSLGGYTFVMKKGDEIIGAVVINKTGMSEYQSENLMTYLAIHKNYRKKGYATKLIKKSINYCNGNITLNIKKENKAIKLFEKNGFESNKIEMTLHKKK
ncbi:GNAT family N-acetyltransferase [uncultured Polaribacter sp.]|uniref:GNAT family N-acetyltransferase n=1 Tax=uncultured Polaribacter sp. TaxID=174711 RepID=UPI00261D94D8|nr:GNAT family N-acetyltransferase [uncultured Polaribacter sp.]